ncbi:hypothetical protein [Dichotomicrobium thermohalophilum]|uniref:Uncharacterized protein n=1 Tax=Dichotomicrobium thermohalophilum TaxID=933063 RepID=A0A397QBC0_9HYPH|nr:hypothetical protein [Dichotomicrobium thermohalophilum]RIA55404.1 hypothetical protein BXY53_0469 [Dichotomicrobium thermohalophilum]
MNQIDLFGESFGTPRYVPKPEHVRNRLQSILDTLRAADSWPWPPVIVRQYRDLTLPYLYEQLHDPAEAARWSDLIDAEIARLGEPLVDTPR